MKISTYLRAKNLPARSIPRAANTTKPLRPHTVSISRPASGGKAGGPVFVGSRAGKAMLDMGPFQTI
jgi:hypothetical protein